MLRRSEVSYKFNNLFQRRSCQYCCHGHCLMSAQIAAKTTGVFAQKTCFLITKESHVTRSCRTGFVMRSAYSRLGNRHVDVLCRYFDLAPKMSYAVVLSPYTRAPHCKPSSLSRRGRSLRRSLGSPWLWGCQCFSHSPYS